MSQHIMDDNEIITSFSNPNYTLNNADALNSNNLPPDQTTTEYYDNEDNSTTTTRNPFNTTNEDDRNTQNINNYEQYRKYITSPAESEGHFSMDSAATSPGEQNESIVSVEHNDTDQESPYTETSTGFQGYYSTLDEVGQDEKESLLTKQDDEVDHVTSDETKKPLLVKHDQKTRIQMESLDPSKCISSPGGSQMTAGSRLMYSM